MMTSEYTIEYWADSYAAQQSIYYDFKVNIPHFISEVMQRFVKQVQLSYDFMFESVLVMLH